MKSDRGEHGQMACVRRESPLRPQFDNDIDLGTNPFSAVMPSVPRLSQLRVVYCLYPGSIPSSSRM
jgi:hypothetical protein